MNMPALFNFPALRCLAFLLVWALAGVLRAAENTDATGRSFDGQFNFAWIDGESASLLDLESPCFLIAIDLRPNEITRSNLPDVGLVSKKPYGDQAGYRLSITGGHGLALRFNTVERETAGQGTRLYEIRGFFTPGQWTRLVVAGDRPSGRLAVYRNGELVREWADFNQVGSLQNWAPFTVGVAEELQHVRFAGRIASVGIWQLTGPLAPDAPAMADAALVGGPGAEASREALARQAGPRWASWRMAEGVAPARDEGPGGLDLRYMPDDDATRLASLDRPFVPPSPRVLIVDAAHSAASPDGPGDADHPFSSVNRAACNAVAGDTVRVRPGLYREGLNVSGGRPGAPIRIVAEPGATLVNATLVSGWEPVEASPGVWVRRGWSDRFAGPSDPQQQDARRTPDSILYWNDAPLEWVEQPDDLFPGSYSTGPRVRGAAIDLYAFPPPGETPDGAVIELPASHGIVLADYIIMEGFEISRAGVSLHGIGCRFEGNTVRWSGVGLSGSRHIVRNNRILWGGHTGLGGNGASATLIESNVVAYANWRGFDPNWHGGGAKIIPSNIDNIVRHNTFEFNWGAGFWYDAYNFGNRVEGNLFRDNAGHAGIFDEMGWANTFCDNIVFNQWCTRQNRSGGNGILIAESSEDVVHRNIVFNCERGQGIVLRGHANRGAYGSAAAVLENFVKYPHHYAAAARHREFLDTAIRYGGHSHYRQVDNRITENIVFQNENAQLWSMRDYRVATPGRDENTTIVSDDNLFFHPDADRAVRSGMSGALSLDAWREVSGMDRASRLVNPLAEDAELPEWARARIDPAWRTMRTAAEIARLRPDIRDGIGSMVFKSRVVRAAAYTRLTTEDPTLRVYQLDVEGRPALAIWKTGGRAEIRVLCGPDPLQLEDRWLRRRMVHPTSEGLVVWAGPDPVYLLGVPSQVAIDASFQGALYGAAADLEIPRASDAMTVDGGLGAWVELPAAGIIAEMNQKRQVAGDSTRTWNGIQDLSGRLRAAWRPDGLFLAIDVQDDDVVPGEDYADIFIDARESWQHFFVEYQPGVFHLRFGPDPAHPDQIACSTPPLEIKTSYGRVKSEPKGVRHAGSVHATGYWATCFIPWTRANVDADAITPDTVIRLGTLIRDGDTGREGTLILKWNADSNSGHRTTGWSPAVMKP